MKLPDDPSKLHPKPSKQLTHLADLTQEKYQKLLRLAESGDPKGYVALLSELAATQVASYTCAAAVCYLIETLLERTGLADGSGHPEP